MNKILIGLIATGLTITPSYADVYVAVDSQGNVVSGAIMCDAITCANGSDYAKATLIEGQHYVLQGNGYAGIGNNNPNTTVKVDEQTNVWTVTTPTSVQQYNNTIENPIIVPSVIDSNTVTDSATVTIDSTTVTSTTSKEEILSTINSLIAKIFALLSLLK